MAIETAGLDLSVVTANADLSAAANQFKAVKIATNDFGVSLATTGGENILGILQNKPAAGQAADVRFAGVSKAVTGAAYSRGAILMTDTSGRLITATSTNQGVAIALEASAAANEIRTVLVMEVGKQ